MSDDLVAFIRDRLNEDEVAAKAAPGENWQAFTEDDIAGASVYDEQWVLLYPQRYEHDNPLSNKPGATGPQYIQRARDELAAHIARHDPARVLREVAAKRRILQARQEQIDDDPYIWLAGDVLLRALASVYSDHESYRDEWRI